MSLSWHQWYANKNLDFALSGFIGTWSIDRSHLISGGVRWSLIDDLASFKFLKKLIWVKRWHKVWDHYFLKIYSSSSSSFFILQASWLLNNKSYTHSCHLWCFNVVKLWLKQLIWAVLPWRSAAHWAAGWSLLKRSSHGPFWSSTCDRTRVLLVKFFRNELFHQRDFLAFVF